MADVPGIFKTGLSSGEYLSRCRLYENLLYSGVCPLVARYVCNHAPLFFEPIRTYDIDSDYFTYMEYNTGK